MSDRPPRELPKVRSGPLAGGSRDSDAWDAWDPPVENDSRDRKQAPAPLTTADIARADKTLAPSLLRRTESEPALFPPLPRKPAGGNGAGLFWFVICVILPMVAAGYYYGRVASPQYVAEFRFSVRDASSQSSGSTTAGLLAILGSSSPAANSNYMVVDFLKSRQVVDELQKRVGVVGLYSKPEINAWGRYNASRPMEAFVKYWNGMVVANYDQITGIASAKVRAFSPDDALTIANAMVSLAEELVNDVANRTYNDAVRFAQGEVTKAEQRLKQVRERLTEYRVRSGVIDPTTSVAASSANLVQTLNSTLAQQEAQLATMMKQNLRPDAPTVVTLKNQIQSTKEQLARLAREVGRNPDGKPLSAVMVEYEQLDLERQFAQTMVTSAMSALDQARANAVAQHLYITPYVRPSLPTASTHPHVLGSVLEVGGIAFVLWLIALLLVRAIRERFA